MIICDKIEYVYKSKAFSVSYRPSDNARMFYYGKIVFYVRVMICSA